MTMHDHAKPSAVTAIDLLLGRRSPALSRAAHAALVSRLYEARPGVLISSAATVAVIGGIAAWRTNDAGLAVLAGLAALLLGAFVPLLSGRLRPDVGTGNAAQAEFRFAVLAIGSSISLGTMCAWTVTATDDAATHLMLVALTLGAVSTVLRNYFRPRIVLLQLAALLVPPSIAMACRGEVYYSALALGGIVFARNLAEIAANLYRSAVESLAKDEDLRRQNLRFDAALNNMAQGLCMFDADGRLLVCNQRYLDLYGFSADVVKPGITLEELLSHSAAIGNHPGGALRELQHKLTEHVTKREPSMLHNRLADGRTIAVFHEPMPDGWVATHEDVTDRLEAEARVRHLARHDALTDLPNRLLFRERVEEAMARARRGEPVALLCLDLDRFKAVNDTLGHHVGDALLKEVAARLRSSLRESDTVARCGGDEFAIVQVGSGQPGGATQLADRIIEIVSAPFEIDGHRVGVGTSIGISVAPNDGCDPDQVLRNADLALYRAKTEGRGQHRFFAPDMDEQVRRRRNLELDLRNALANGEFQLAYQPLVTAASGAVTGFEALLRWHHPARGLVMPSDFIPVAEEIGVIASIGEWVLHEACAAAAEWPDDIRIAVNLSPAQFRGGDLVRTVAAALSASGLAAVRLELEITEGVLLADAKSTLAILHELRDLGVRIAMDDFGTGYSSFSYLRTFPFDKIKIDQSFVRDIGSDNESIAIVRAVTSLGRSLGISTTAEGIETAEQMAHLRAEGCTELQGYLLGRPMPESGAAALVARKSRQRTPEPAAV